MTFAGISPGAGGLAGATTVPPTVTASNSDGRAAPTVSQANNETLSVNGVACPTSNFCVAVGSQGAPQSTLI